MNFKIGENEYQSGKLNAFDQLFIVKRLAGALKDGLPADLIAALASRLDEKSSAEVDPMSYLQAFTGVISNIPDQDVVFIINTCCKVTQRFQNGAWANLMVGGVMAFMDISASPSALLQIAFNVIRENLTSFFSDLGSILGQEAKPTPPPQVQG